jgi:alpha-N-arabinofuranosidase
MLFSKLASGNALDVGVKAPAYETKQFGTMPVLDVSASYNEATGNNAIFIVNRSQTESTPIELHWQDHQPKSIKSAHQLAGTDPKAVNSFENPNQVVAVAIDTPAVKDGCVSMMLPPLSFTVLEVTM